MLEGYVFLVGKWKKLTKEDHKKMKSRYSKLNNIGRKVKHYHQRKVGEEIILAFSSSNFFYLCDGEDWAIQYSPGFLRRAQSDDTAVPEGFVLIPDLNMGGLLFLNTLFVKGQIEVVAFYRRGTMYQAKIMNNGQLFMKKI